MSDHADTIREALTHATFQTDSLRCQMLCDAALAALAAFLSELDTLREANQGAMRALTALYNEHVIDGDPPCPCSGCEKAREVFADAVRRNYEAAALAAAGPEHRCEACDREATEVRFSPEDGDLWFCSECLTALIAAAGPEQGTR